MLEKIKGTIKFYKADKGYGFATPDNGGGDVFVHITDIKEAGYTGLNKGDRIEFVKVENRGRTKAVDIAIIN